MILKKINYLTKIFFVVLLVLLFSRQVLAEESSELKEIIAKIDNINMHLFREISTDSKL